LVKAQGTLFRTAQNQGSMGFGRQNGTNLNPPLALTGVQCP
jgi:hypothetical protein